jgi:hypothetical protein
VIYNPTMPNPVRVPATPHVSVACDPSNNTALQITYQNLATPRSKSATLYRAIKPSTCARSTAILRLTHHQKTGNSIFFSEATSPTTASVQHGFCVGKRRRNL